MPSINIPLKDIIIPSRKRGINADKAKGLAGSIAQNGLINPITLDDTNSLLAGLHRIEAVKILGWETIPARIIGGLDALQAELIEIDENLIRDELTPLQAGAQLNRRNEILKELGLRATADMGRPRGDTVSPLKSTADLAAEAGLSERSAQRLMQIDRDILPEVKEMIAETELEEGVRELLSIARLEPELQMDVAKKIIDGEAKTVIEARQQIKKDDRQADLEQQKQAIVDIAPPTGLFNVISLDPPWPYGTKYDPAGRRVANPYPEMSLEEIADIELPAAEDCILWLWTTHKFMRHSFTLLDGWGFRDVAIVTWVKDRMGIGTWLRSQTEFCIMAVKGKPTIDLTNQVTVLYGDAREHSRKPDTFYNMVDSLCVGYKIDYFSREVRLGWVSYGNETDKF